MTNRWRTLIIIALGVNEKNAAIDAEGIEHHVSNETLNAMDRFASARSGRAA